MEGINNLLFDKETILTDEVVDLLIDNSDYVGSDESLLMALLDLSIRNQLKDFDKQELVIRLADHYRDSVTKYIDAEAVIIRATEIAKELGIER